MSDVDDLDFTPEGIERLIVASADHLDDWYADRGITTTRRKYRDALAASESTVAAMRAENEALKTDIETFWKQQFDEQCLRAETAEAEVERLTKAVRQADEAIAEYIRYLDGGEMRGSYDGKPERDALRKAGYATHTAARALDRSPSVEPGK